MEGFETTAGEQRVLTALDTAWQKFGKFASEAMIELQFADTDVAEAREILTYDVILFLPKIRGFLNKHKSAMDAQDVKYFQHLCPPKFAFLRDVEVPPKIAEKGFLFARVFESLLNDLARTQ